MDVVNILIYFLALSQVMASPSNSAVIGTSLLQAFDDLARNFLPDFGNYIGDNISKIIFFSLFFYLTLRLLGV